MCAWNGQHKDTFKNTHTHTHTHTQWGWNQPFAHAVQSGIECVFVSAAQVTWFVCNCCLALSDSEASTRVRRELSLNRNTNTDSLPLTPSVHSQHRFNGTRATDSCVFEAAVSVRVQRNAVESIVPSRPRHSVNSGYYFNCLLFF